MGEVVLIRHAQASLGTGDYDRLSPLGHEQAAWLGLWLRAHDLSFDRVIRGDLRRHAETAAALDGLGPAPVVDPRFDEFHYFGLQQEYQRLTGTEAARSREDFLETFPAVLGRWAAGEIGRDGETFDAFETRVIAGLADAVEPGETTLVVTSGGVIGVILRHILGLSHAATADVMLAIRNASIHRIQHEGGRLRLSLFNAHPHLDPADRAHARTYV
jgi:broad specificity phosphatase PhoE